MNEKDEAALQNSLKESLGIELSAQENFQHFRQALVDYINELIDRDFEKLIFILYKIDVDENKFKDLLVPENADAAGIAADLIIERQLQKIKLKSTLKREENISDEDKW